MTRVAVFAAYDQVPPGADAPEYLGLARRVASGHGFPHDGFRTPGYPLFIAALEPLPGAVEDAVSAVQHLLGIVLVVAMLHVTWHFFGKAAGILAAGLAALTPGLATLENWVLADFLFGFVVFFAVVLLAYAVERGGSLRLYAAAGLAIGVAALIKPAGQFLIPGAALGILLGTHDLRATLKGIAAVGAVAALVVAPWVVRTATSTGEVALSTQGGVTLYNRAFELDRLPVPRTQPGGPLLRHMQTEMEANHDVCVRACVVRRTGRFHIASLDELMARGYSKPDALKIQQRLAEEAIGHAPASYAANTAKRTADEFVAAHEFFQRDIYGKPGDDYREKLDAFGLPAPLRLAGIAWIMALETVAWVWLVLGACGLVPLLLTSDRRRRAGAGAFAAGWLAIALLTAATHGGMWRYSISLAPLSWVLGAAGAVALVAAVRRRPARVPRSVKSA